MSNPRNIHQQIEEVERELRVRAHVYPGLIGRGKLRQRDAEEQTARLRAALETLIWCRDNRALIAAVKDAAPSSAVPAAPLPHDAGEQGGAR